MIIVRDWNGTECGRYDDLGEAIAAADRITEDAGSCVRAEIEDEHGRQLCRICGDHDCQDMDYCDQE